MTGLVECMITEMRRSVMSSVKEIRLVILTSRALRQAFRLKALKEGKSASAKMRELMEAYIKTND